MVTGFDFAMMQRALFHAARGAGRTAPNPMVGAVVVTDRGVVVGHGWHERAGGAHAEVHALDDAGDRARGGTLYVTLEPCCHVGRTGPCTARIVEAGIRRVVAAMRDPDPRMNGQGFEQLRAHGVEVVEDLCAAEAGRLNAAFVTSQRAHRPLVVLKAATSLDGRVAAAHGARTPLTSSSADARTHLLRAAVDAVGIGSGTACVDDPLLTVRGCYRIRPLVRIVFDRRLRTPASARLWSTLGAGPVLIVTHPIGRDPDRVAQAARLRAAGAEIVEAETLGAALRALLARDVLTLLIEGGPTLQASFVEAGLVDRLHLIVTPKVLGTGGVAWIDARRWPWSAVSVVTTEPLGPDTWVEADVHGTR